MIMPKTRDERLNAIVNAFAWKRIDEESYDSLYIYDKVLKSIFEHTKHYQSDILYDVVSNRDRMREKVQNKEFGPVSIIAVRECGVDGVDFTYSRLDGCTSENYAASVKVVGLWYSDIFLLSLETDPFSDTPIVTLSLAEIDSFRGIRKMGGSES